MKLSLSKSGGVNKSNIISGVVSSQSHTETMLERRTRLPKLVITDAELSYPLEFDENQGILFLSFSLSDLGGINVSYTRANAERVLTSIRIWPYS